MKPTFIHLFKARIAWLVIAGLMAHTGCLWRRHLGGR